MSKSPGLHLADAGNLVDHVDDVVDGGGNQSGDAVPNVRKQVVNGIQGIVPHTGKEIGHCNGHVDEKHQDIADDGERPGKGTYYNTGRRNRRPCEMVKGRYTQIQSPNNQHNHGRNDEQGAGEHSSI